VAESARRKPAPAYGVGERQETEGGPAKLIDKDEALSP
jgi:hypothetical protein